VDSGNQRSRLATLIEDAIARWRSGERPDAAAFFERHPEIGSKKELALDLIHEELCLRREAGDTVVASTFVARFPAYQSSVVKMLQVEQYGEANPQFAEALAESLWPQPGQSFQGFEIVEPLGRGAMARVYLARETDMGRRPVVVKVSQHGGHEAHLLGKLEHDNIVAAHSVKHDDETGMTVICMPLLGTATGLNLLDAAFRKAERPLASADVIGQTARRYRPAEVVNEEHLKEAISFSSLSYVEGIVWIGQQLAEGLAAANALGVVHHDIKPSNVLLAWSGRPMLLDFNLSSGAEHASDRIGGTIAYMAPERIDLLREEGAAREEGFEEQALDPQPDIFSLGVLLYELLTGRLPVQPMDAEGTDDAALKRWRESRVQSVAPPSRLNDAVDATIDQIILRCLAVDPAQRYATAAELSAALRAYLHPRARAARWARRHRRGLLASAAALAISMAAGGAYWATRPPAHEVYYQEGLQRFAAGDYAGAVTALTNSLADQPDSVKALFARGQSHYWLGVENGADRDHRFELAQADFAAAGDLDNQGLFWFCAACCGLSGPTGAGHLKRAIEANFDEAAVRCNLGVNFDNSGQRNLAINEFTGAIVKNKQLQEAYLERAFVYMNEAATTTNPKLLPLAVADIERAEELGPPSRRLHFIAARIHADRLKQTGSGREEAAEHLQRFIELGGDPDKYKSDNLLGPLLKQLGPLDTLPPTELRAAPDPPRGVLPPKSADLSDFPLR
jgi:serine/threonine protein kinase